MKNSGFMVSVLLLLLISSASAQLDYPQLEISFDDEKLSVSNPTDHEYSVDLVFFFWGDSDDRWTTLPDDVSISANTITAIGVDKLGEDFSPRRDGALPVKIATTLADEKKRYSVLLYKLDSDKRYVLDEQSTTLLTESVRELPGYMQENESGK